MQEINLQLRHQEQSRSTCEQQTTDTQLICGTTTACESRELEINSEDDEDPTVDCN